MIFADHRFQRETALNRMDADITIRESAVLYHDRRTSLDIDPIHALIKLESLDAHSMHVAQENRCGTPDSAVIIGAGNSNRRIARACRGPGFITQ